ncbi:MAG: hypothetical protein V3V01_06240 [Acidimicrobiales bacterium]
MKIQRVVIEDGGGCGRFVDFDPRLTIVAGLDEADRRVLLSELRSSLGAHRDGVHVELVSDAGSYLAVFRGKQGDHRVIDVATTTDVTARFRDASGNVNPAFGLGLQDEQLVVDSGVLSSRVDEDRQLDLLTGTDQDTLWGILERIEATRQVMSEAELAHASTTAETPDDLTAEVYDNYFTGGQSVPILNKVVSGMSLAVVAFAITLILSDRQLIGGGMALLGLIAFGFFGFPILRQWRAQRAADRALEEAGASNYLDFQLKQVDDMMAQDEMRKKLREAVTEHEKAIGEWHQLAGEIDPSFALEHRTAISGGAELRAADPNNDPDSGFLHPTTPLLLRCVGSVDAEGERVPRILDAPFHGLNPETRRILLDTMFAASQHRQIVLLAADDDETTWAMEHLDEGVSIVPGFSTIEKPESVPVA